MEKENDIHTHVVLVTAFIQKGKKFLLAKRSQNDPQAGGMWSIPGGKVELDIGKNILEKTLKKEIIEEVGVTIKDDCIFLGSSAFIRVSGHHVIGLTFLVQWRAGIATPMEGQEDVKWYTIEELKKLTHIPIFLKNNLSLLYNHLESTQNKI